ncbi:uncharacterized protein LOC107468298 [Arachis duranensis]|uniref:Uncharacterized protein LOC107468298 n=1 Tax=Arachis duranensis TaxID=130453 RepID=A0A6P4C4G0_ARADU|nr:uncharacterized protein LOC107468298 [Arachis duranensis]
MAERKLNINAPLMSVRRTAATSSLYEARKRILEKRHTLPPNYNNSDMDQLTEPVAVPFNWEHIPGRRKGNSANGNGNSAGSDHQPSKEASNTPSPRLPPGKSTNASFKQPSEKDSKLANKIRVTNKSNSFNVSVVRNKMDGGREKKAESIVEIRRSNVEEKKVNKDNDDGDDDDAFSDALETLSQTQSFSMNCSESGVSGLDTLDAKKLGTVSTDQQTRDFMMSRFLPAAKAMTLQPPQYSSKKQQSGVLVEQPLRDVTKLIRDEKKPLLSKQITDIIPYSAQCQEEEEESENEGDDYDNSANISAKGCGLLPRLHVRNSLCLLNPMPDVKIKSQVSLPSSNEVVKPSKISQIRSFSPIPAVKKAWDAIHNHKNKSSSGGASPDLQEGRKKWTSDSNRFTYYSGELLPGRLSPFRRSRAAAAGVSPCRSKPQSPFRGARLPSDPREGENNQPGRMKFHSSELGKFREIPSMVAPKRSSYSGNLTTEKTLYIDTASTVKLSSSNLSSVDKNLRIDTLIAELDKRRGKETSHQDTNHVQAIEEKDSLDSSSDANSSTLSSMLLHKAKEDKDEALKTDQEVRNSTDDSMMNNQQIVLAESPLPPPLPKSPSESWLWKALPLVSAKNSFLHSNQSNAKRQDSNTASSNIIKWETIVKTSNLHHDHVRYSQELITHNKSQH